MGTIGTSTAANANSFFLDIPRDFPLAQLILDLSGTLTVTGGTTNGTLVDENPFTYLRKIFVNLSGGPASLQLKNLKGIQAYRLHHLFESREPGGIGRVTSGAAASYPFRAIIPIDFALPGELVTPELAALTILNGREWSGIQLQLDMGDATDFINGGDRVLSFTGNVNCDVFCIVATNFRPNVPTPPHPHQTLPRQSFSAIAAENLFNITFPVGKLYRHLLFRTTNEAGNVRQPVDD